MKLKIKKILLIAGLAGLGQAAVLAQGTWNTKLAPNPLTDWTNNGTVVKASNLGNLANVSQQIINGITFDTNFSNVVRTTDGNSTVQHTYYSGPDAFLANLVNNAFWTHGWSTSDPNNGYNLNFTNLIIGHNYQFQILIGFPWNNDGSGGVQKYNQVNLFGPDSANTSVAFYPTNAAIPVGSATPLGMATFNWTATANAGTFKLMEVYGNGLLLSPYSGSGESEHQSIGYALLDLGLSGLTPPTISGTALNQVTMATNTSLSYVATAATGAVITNVVIYVTSNPLGGTEALTVLTNGSPGLTVTGLGTATVNIGNALATNTMYYSVVTKVFDNQGLATSTTCVSFDTLSPALVVESADFNFSNGQFIDTPVNGGLWLYANKVGMQNVDEFKQANNPAYNPPTSWVYRPSDAPIILPANPDTSVPQKYVTATANGNTNVEYFVAWTQSGDWLNYTRTFGSGGSAPAGNYFIYAYMAVNGSAGQHIQFSQVSGNPTTTSQSTNILGYFAGSGSDWNSYSYSQLVGANGLPVAVTITNGQQTFQSEFLDTFCNAAYYVLMPAPITPVSVLTQPVSQRVLTNNPVTFTVGAAGVPISYQWYVISGGITNAIPNANSFNYSIPSVQDSLSGNGYFVVLNNPSNQVASQVAVLTAGHIITSLTPGFIENDEFNTSAWSTPGAALRQIYPGSPWLAANAPTRVQYLQKLDDNQDLATNSAERIYGYFTPPVTGNYIFYVASDDAAAFWLSTNSSPTNVYQIAQNQAWMNPYDWTLTQSCGESTAGNPGEYRSDQFESGGGQQNVQALTGVNGGQWAAWPNLNNDGSIPLTAGTAYYVELDHYQGNGGQTAAVTYKLAGQGDPAYQSTTLLTYANGSISAVQAIDGGMVVITNQPANITVSPGNAATFLVTAGAYIVGAPTAAPPLQYRWFMVSGGVTNLIAGANGSSYTTAAQTLANSGQQFYCQLTTVAFQTNSSLATLSVQVAPPTISGTWVSGGQLIFSGTGGTAGNSYAVLVSTNLANPNWVPVITNTFDAGGAFSVTNNINSLMPQRFYRIKLLP